jgi:endonuclease III
MVLDEKVMMNENLRTLGTDLQNVGIDVVNLIRLPFSKRRKVVSPIPAEIVSDIDMPSESIQAPPNPNITEASSKKNECFVELALKAYEDHHPAEHEQWLFDNYPHIHFLFWIADRGIKVNKAKEIPEKIAKIFGGYEFDRFTGKPEEWWINFFQEHDQFGHRLGKSIAIAYSRAIKQIQEEYESNVCNIWNDSPSAKILTERLTQFNGIGQKIANMAVIILVRDYKVNLGNYDDLEIAVDVNVMKVFCRMGLVSVSSNRIDKADNKTIQNFIDAAKQIYPKAPWKLDLLAWWMGKNYCHKTNPACADCLLSTICQKLV